MVCKHLLLERLVSRYDLEVPKPTNELAAVAPKRRRMPAESRRASILEAARRTFAATGDLGGTTTKMIAQEAGISEAVIYRHFESKDELFFASVVEPLRAATATFSQIVEALPSVMTEEERILNTERMFRRLITTLGELTPLLGLVLFGDPERAREFYRESWRPFLDELGRSWSAFYKRAGVSDYPDSRIAARVVAGASLVAALDTRYGRAVAGDSTSRILTELMFDGVFLRVE